jgi:hypothetical protein
MKQTTMLELDASPARPRARGRRCEEAGAEKKEAALPYLLARGAPHRWESSTAGRPLDQHCAIP